MKRHFIDISAQLESWFETESGQYLLNAERGILSSQLESIFGYHMAQIGVSSKYPLYESCPVSHKFSIGGSKGAALLTTFSDLPFKTDSLDLVILHHSLEYYEHPHELLRESQRCIAPQGHLIIVGFNPLSPHGLYAQVAGLLPSSQWKKKPITLRRLVDWLSLLGFDIRSTNYAYTLPPVHRKSIQERMTKADQYITSHNWPTGGIFVLNAVKQVSTITPIRPRWNKVANPLRGLATSRSVISRIPNKGETQA
jgi:SAM-dependent methyltransferase